MMKTYFDITEIFYLASKGRPLSGVSRVVFELGSELARRGAIPFFFDLERARFRIGPQDHLAAASMFDPAAWRERLGAAIETRNYSKYAKTPWKYAFHITLDAMRFAAARGGSGASQAPPDDADAFVLLGGLVLSSKVAARLAQAGSPRIVALLHDVLPLHRRYGETEGFVRANIDALNLLGARAETIVTNSAHTRREYEAFVADGRLEAARGSVTTIPLAHEFRASDAAQGAHATDGVEAIGTGPEEEVATTGSVPRGPRALLYVGPLYGRKNGKILLDASLSLLQTGETPPPLIIAGRIGREDRALFAPGGAYEALVGHVTVIDSPSDREIAALLRDALALVYTSLHEGFGLPVGEALWAGAPVIASSATSIPEVGGDLVDYFDPTDVESLAAQLRRIARDPNWRADRVAAIAAARGGLRRWSDVADDWTALLAARR